MAVCFNIWGSASAGTISAMVPCNCSDTAEEGGAPFYWVARTSCIKSRDLVFVRNAKKAFGKNSAPTRCTVSTSPRQTPGRETSISNVVGC